MANRFSVDVPNVFQALMAGEQGFDRTRASMAEQDMRAGRQEAMEALQSGGDLRSPLAKLIGIGDVKGAEVIAHFAKNNAEGNGVYGTPIMLQQPDGTYKVGAIGKQGEGRVVDFGAGNAPTVPSKSVDTGTGTVIIPGRVTGGGAVPGAQPQPGAPQAAPGQAAAPQGVPSQGYIPKDLAGAESAKVYGRERGEAQANLASMRSKLPGLREVSKQLGDLGDQATYTGTGQILDAARTQLNLGPRDAAVARTKYIAMVDNQILPLLRETFGAQFTQREGESLKVTLGDPNKSPKEKRAVLEAFIAQKERNIEATAAQIGQEPSGPAPPKIGEPRDGYRYKGGNPADPSSWVKLK